MPTSMVANGMQEVRKVCGVLALARREVAGKAEQGDGYRGLSAMQMCLFHSLVIVSRPTKL